MKIHPVGAELYQENRRTDMTKLTVAFHNFAKPPKKYLLCIDTIQVAGVMLSV